MCKSFQKMATMLVISFLLVQSSFAGPNDPPIYTSGMNWFSSMGHPGDDLCLLLGTDGLIYANMHLYMADNQVQNYRPMHIQYNFGNQRVGYTPAITQAELTEVNIGGHIVYEYHMQIELNMQQDCEGMPIDHYIPVTFDYALVTYDPSEGYSPYPLYNISALFPPSIFIEVSQFGWDFTYSETKDVCCMTNPLGHNLRVTATSEMAESGLVDGLDDEEVKLSVDPLSKGALEVDEALTVKELKAFPNPFRNELNVQFDLANRGDVLLEVFDGQGRNVFAATERDVAAGLVARSYNYADLPKGIYYLKISSGTLSQSTKIVKFGE